MKTECCACSVRFHSRSILASSLSHLADASDEMRRVEQVLAATGLVTAPGGAAPSLAPGSELRLAETAERYAVGGPLSEVVIAERDER